MNISIKDPIFPRQLKFMVVGDSGVGKTSLIKKFLNNDDLSPSESTNNVDIFFKKIKVKDGSVSLNVNFNLKLVKYLGFRW